MAWTTARRVSSHTRRCRTSPSRKASFKTLRPTSDASTRNDCGEKVSVEHEVMWLERALTETMEPLDAVGAVAGIRRAGHLVRASWGRAAIDAPTPLGADATFYVSTPAGPHF